MSNEEYTVRELRVGHRKEAELLADMWNRSEAGWPGGWTGGVPWTADLVMRDFMQHRCYARWAVEHGGEIVGYVSLEADPAEPSNCYVGLLSARPDHHGKGVGRRLVRRAVQQAIQDGFERVELHTWAGNLKAVPLYKKCGFFWSPETRVHMQNFIPAIVRMPLLADMFEGRDWYRIQQRDLSVAEDLERWHGVRVYHYRFAAAERHADLIVDRNAAMLTAVETERLAVSAWAGREDLCALQEQVLRYEFINKTDRPMAVTLTALGEGGVPVSREESFTLKKRRRLNIPFRLPPDLKPKRPGEPCHRVLATVTVDGVPIRLGTAVRMRQPVEIEYRGQGLAAGVWTELQVKLRNRLPYPVSGVLWVGSDAGVERKDERLGFRIPRLGWSSVSLRVRAVEAGAHALEMRVCLSEETAARLAKGTTPALPPRGKPHVAWLRAFAPAAPAVSRDEESRVVTVESDGMQVTFGRTGGWMSVTEKARGRHLFSAGVPALGPPFGGFKPVPKTYDVDVRRVGGAVHLVTRQDDDRYPGLTLERTVIVTERMLEFRHRLINAADGATEVQVRVPAWGTDTPHELTVPDGDGLIRHVCAGRGDWPVGSELRRRTDDFPESWLAAEHEGAVVGMIWNCKGVVLPDGGTGELTYDAVSVPAGGHMDLPPLYFVAGPGDHRTVRALWATYVHSEPLLTPEQKEPPERALVRCNVRDGGGPALLTTRRRRLVLELASEMRRPIEGKAGVTLPRAITFTNGKRERSMRVHALAKDAPFRRPVAVRTSARRPTAATGEVVLTTQREQYRLPLPFVVVRAGRGKLKLDHDGDVVAVDTGVIRFRVSAGHAGSLFSLGHGGRELLRSSYPKPGPYQWMNLWHGGLTVGPGNPWDGRFTEADRSIRPVSVRGAEGLLWQGAEVTTDLTHPDLCWLRCRTQYLATAGSNLLAVIATLHIRVAAPMGGNLSLALWPRTGGAAWAEGPDGRPQPFKADRYAYDVRAGRWGAIECGTRNVLATVLRREPGSHLGIQNLGDGNFQFAAHRRVQMTPKLRSGTSLAWVVPCRSMDEAHAYRCLMNLRELP